MKGRNIFLDHFFINISIIDWCLEKKITSTRTMTKDRIEIPSEMKLETGQEANSTIWRYNVKKMQIKRRQRENLCNF